MPIKGTIAIDFGSSTTVVAFQGEREKDFHLIDLNPISRVPGEVPSLLWENKDLQETISVGQIAKDLNLASPDDKNLIFDFKRWIGSTPEQTIYQSNITPEEAGEILIKEVWKRIPSNFLVQRLVLSAPVETYKSYRKWLNKVCSELEVKEIALVDEPTAAAMGAGLEPGAKLLVIDIGGSTTDTSMVTIEGGEGQNDPIAQLIRFNDQDLEAESKQILRTAKVLGKSGLRIGGQDLDRWILNHLYPNIKPTKLLLDSIERLKCRLSEEGLNENKYLNEQIRNDSDPINELRLNKIKLEEILIKEGYLKSLKRILEKTLSQGRSNGCELKDLTGVVLVGGGSRIPLIRKWLENEVYPAKIITPPPIEAVAIGALKLTPGVVIKDVLNKGVSLRYWDQKACKHSWHPLFFAGQPWPTVKPLSINLGVSTIDQTAIEIQISDYLLETEHEIIYIKGIPQIKNNISQRRYSLWEGEPTSIPLSPPAKPGEDCIQLKFNIDSECSLIVECFDIRKGTKVLTKNLGSLH